MRGVIALRGTTVRREVAIMVGEGTTNRRISSELGISRWTVTNHPRAVMRKPGCGDRVHVVGPLGQARR
ncbi:LuxR C-terminal-related transcriptional regulator [Streptomyces sp. NBC_01508]|uniref:LuxR C-terminal-related transcriptional regulator n=1 Tax=Streptomyces sp. NBC_01508 TaxID=2903888 RepID=UPI0038636161